MTLAPFVVTPVFVLPNTAEIAGSEFVSRFEFVYSRFPVEPLVDGRASLVVGIDVQSRPWCDKIVLMV